MATISTRRKILNGLGYASFFFTSVVVLSYFTFPYDRVRDFIVQEVENPKNAAGMRTPSGWRLEIVELGPHWLTGVELTGLQLKKVPASPEDRPIIVRIDEATARVSLLSLLTGTIEVAFDVQTAGGSIEGSFSQGGDEQHLLADLTSVDLRQLGLPQAALGLPVAGRLAGHIDLTIGATPAATKGEVKLTVASLVIGDANAKLKLEGMGDGLTVGRITAGNIAIEAKAENGVLKIEKLQGDGSDVVLRGSGQMRLGRALAGSTLDLLVSAKFSDAFRDRDDRTRAIFSIVDLQPQLRRAKTPDGALQWQIAGPVGGIRASAAGNRPTPR